MIEKEDHDGHDNHDEDTEKKEEVEVEKEQPEEQSEEEVIVQTTEDGEVVFNAKMHNPDNESKVIAAVDPGLSAWDSIDYKPAPSDGPFFG